MDKETISVKELSKTLGISLPIAYKLVKSRGFPHINIGGRILVPVSEFREWLSKNTEK